MFIRSNEFLSSCQSILDRHPDVFIDEYSLKAYAKILSIPKFIPDWADYIDPQSDGDLAAVFYDFALNASQNAGYYFRRNGEIQKWEKEGSGAKALVSFMSGLRSEKVLPTLHSEGNLTRLEEEARHLPFATQRMDIFAELSSHVGKKSLTEIFQSVARPGGSYHFAFDHIAQIAKDFPKGFGEDPFLKKASLIPILFAGYAHSKGIEVSMDTFIPADYRIPQTLHNIGILRLSDSLVQKIENNELFDQNEDDVDAIRAASIVAVYALQKLRPDLKLHHIDGELWFAGRKPESLNGFWEKIGQKSSFYKEGFSQRTLVPMEVATLRF